MFIALNHGIQSIKGADVLREVGKLFSDGLPSTENLQEIEAQVEWCSACEQFHLANGNLEMAAKFEEATVFYRRLLKFGQKAINARM